MFDGPSLRKSIWFKQGKIGGFYCRDLRKLIPLVKRKWNSFILYGGYGLAFDLIHDLNILKNRLLLCSLNPGIFLIFESRHLQSRVVLLPLWSNLYFSPLPQSLVWAQKLELTLNRSLDDNPTSLFYSGSSSFINFVLNSSAFPGLAFYTIA